MAELSLNFWRIFNYYRQQWKYHSYPFPIQQSITSYKCTIEDVQELAATVESESLYSRNEIFEDLPTSTLKYLLLPLILAEALENDSCDPESRLPRLHAAAVQYSLHVLTLCRLGQELKEYRTYETQWEAIKKNPQREDVIMRRRRMQELDRLMTLHTAEGLAEEDTPEGRSFWLSVLERSVLEAMINTELLLQEIDLLKMRPELGESGPSSPMGTEGTVLKKPFIIKIANNAELRKLFASEVFTPGHILPTVSLAEAAAIEIECDVKTLGAAQARSMTVVDEYREDTHEEEDQKERKARAWDDWKDANPRGSGNKMVNRG